MIYLSVVIPVYNEEKILKDNIEELIRHLSRVTDSYEVILVNNGSFDQTEPICQELSQKYPQINLFTCPKGLGRALKLGFDQAEGPVIHFTAIDSPFGLTIVEDSLSYIKDYDLVIGSKAHEQSINQAPKIRKFVSKIYRFLLKSLFHLKVKDPQGTLMFKREILDKVKPYCVAHHAFFTTQFVLYTQAFGFRIKEIPVNYLSPRKSSKFNILSEGLTVFWSLIKEYKKYRFKFKK